MEILKVIVRPLAARLPGQHLTDLAALAASVDRWQILEEEARAGEQVRQCAVVIYGQRIDAGLDIGEVLPEQDRHVGVETPAIGHAHARLRALSGAFAHSLAQAPHYHAMADIPSNARHLACAIGHARGELRHGIGHAVAPQWLGYSITRFDEPQPFRRHELRDAR